MERYVLQKKCISSVSIKRVVVKSPWDYCMSIVLLVSYYNTFRKGAFCSMYNSARPDQCKGKPQLNSLAYFAPMSVSPLKSYLLSVRSRGHDLNPMRLRGRISDDLLLNHIPGIYGSHVAPTRSGSSATRVVTFAWSPSIMPVAAHDSSLRLCNQLGPFFRVTHIHSRAVARP